jgi:BolA protein
MGASSRPAKPVTRENLPAAPVGAAELESAMSTKSDMEAILVGALHPQSLEIIDESHMHAGHGGWRPGGETHFRVRVTAAAFNGRSRLDRHRMVNALLAEQLRVGVHALAIEARGTEEGSRPA